MSEHKEAKKILKIGAKVDCPDECPPAAGHDCIAGNPKICKLQNDKQELLGLLKKTIKLLKAGKYCIEDGDCALEDGPNWMFDIQEMIEETLKKYEGDNNQEVNNAT